MITIEQTLNILKQGQNFEVLVNGEYYYHLEETSFDAISAMIAGRFLLAPSFCPRGQLQKEYLEPGYFPNGLSFNVSERLL